jgi:hypothetical protein
MIALQIKLSHGGIKLSIKIKDLGQKFQVRGYL